MIDSSALPDFSALSAAKRSPEYKRLMAKLRDREWRLDNLYRIKDTSGTGIPFVRNAAQRAYCAASHLRDLIPKARQLGFCLDPDTRVLTADLRWMRIDDLPVGSEIVAVDESPPGGRGPSRKMRTGVVLAKNEVFEPALRLTMSNGERLVLTRQHRMLCRRRGGVEMIWRRAREISHGDEIRFITKPWDKPTIEDGWFGGMLDGEGSLNTSSGASVGVSQLKGPVWDRLIKYVQDRGYNFCIENDEAERKSKYGKVPVPKVVIGRMNELFRLLGQTRPTRFINKRWWEGKHLPGSRTGDTTASIMAVELLPAQRMIDIQTSTKTFIAEGFVSHNSTLLEIEMLDTCLFLKNTRAGIIDATLNDARDKLEIIKFAYDGLMPELRQLVPMTKRNTETIEWANGSSVEIGTSARGGTFQFLHISEYGKTSVNSPDTAREIKLGAIPAVHAGNRLVVESTAHGTAGEFHDMVQRADAILKERRELTPLDFKLHFFGWWMKPEYRVQNNLVHITHELREYFAKLAPDLLARGIRLDADQQAWYAQQYYELGPDDCRQEYPTTFQECFYNSLEGAFFKAEMSKARAEERIGKPVPHDPTRRVNTFWDIGEDGTAIIWHQTDGVRHRIIDYWEEEGGSLQSAIGVVEQKRIERKFVYGEHYGPHDLENKDWAHHAKSRKDTALELGVKFTVVPRVLVKADSIEAARRMISMAWFDVTYCSLLVDRLDNYRKKWNKALGQFSAEPEHKKPSHSADALQQGAMGLAPERVKRDPRPPGRRGSSWGA